MLGRVGSSEGLIFMDFLNADAWEAGNNSFLAPSMLRVLKVLKGLFGSIRWPYHKVYGLRLGKL